MMRRTATIFFFVFLTIIFPARADEQFITGVCTHFVQRKGLLDENIRLIRELGVTSIRDEIPWSQVETNRGVYEMPQRVTDYVNAADKAGLKLVIPLGYANALYDGGKKPTSDEALTAYANYCRFIVSHFKGKIKWYEIWNEYNIGIGVKNNEPGTPENYVKMLEIAAKTVRETDPDAVIIGGVVAPQALSPNGYFDKACELGMLRHCDVVSVHTYNYAQPKQTRTPEAWLNLMKRIEQTVRKSPNGEKTAIWVTEHGWPTHAGPGGSPLQLSADFLARTYLLARTLPSVQGLWWYDFQDDGWNLNYNEDNFGLVRADLTPKPAYAALQQVAPIVSTARFDEEIASDEPIRILRFTTKEGNQLLAAWSTLDHPQGVQAIFTSSKADENATARVTVVGRPPIERKLVHRNWPASPRDAEMVPGQLSVLLTSTPVLIETGADRLELKSTIRRPLHPTTQPTSAPAE